METEIRLKKGEVYKKMGVVLAVTCVIAFLVFQTDNSKELPVHENGMNSLERNHPGKGKREEELQVQIGDTKEKITVEVAEKMFSEEEIQQEFEKAGAELETLILGENRSLDEVRSDLNLISALPDSPITVTWELDNYKVMNLQGELKQEALKKEGTLLRLDAFLSYREENVQRTFYANIFPPKWSEKEQKIQKLKAEMKELDEETKEEEEMLLPDQIDGATVEWSYVKDFRAGGILLLGVTMVFAVYILDKQKEKKEKQDRLRQLEMDYPEIINRFTLFMGAGMPVRKVWFKLAEEYEHRERKEEKHAVYEEMVYTMHEIQSGTSESECYERFGERCGAAIYRKFGMLLAQNLKKGTKGLTLLLKQEAVNVFEERKNLARKVGEETGTRLLMPMFLMFGMVLTMIVIPAFFTMQI